MSHCIYGNYFSSFLVEMVKEQASFSKLNIVKVMGEKGRENVFWGKGEGVRAVKLQCRYMRYLDRKEGLGKYE